MATHHLCIPLRVLLGLVCASGVTGAGCSHSMKMPPPDFLCRGPEPREISDDGPIRRTAILDESGIGEFGLGGGWVFDGTELGASVKIEPSTADEQWAGQFHFCIGVWDLTTGKLIRQISVPGPTPGEGWFAYPVLVSRRHDLLITQGRDELVVRRLSDGGTRTLIPLPQIPATGPSEVPVYDWVSCGPDLPPSERPRLSDDGAELVACLSNARQRVRWNLDTGQVLSCEPLGEHKPPTAAACDGMELTKDLVLQTPAGSCPLFAPHEEVCPSTRPVFSPGCDLVAVPFGPPIAFLDFTPDKTPRHTRVFDTRTGGLVAWFHGDQVGPYVPGTGLMLAMDGGDANLVDPRARRVVFSATAPGTLTRFQPFGDGLWLVVDQADHSEVWRVAPE